MEAGIFTMRFSRWRYMIVDVSQVFSAREEVTDTELVRSFLAGNAWDFERIVYIYTNPLYKYLYYYFQFKRDIAQDLAQGIFVKLWEKLHLYDPKQKFSTWLYRFAHNYVIDWQRVHGKEELTSFFSEFSFSDDESWHNMIENIVVSDDEVLENVDQDRKMELLQLCLNAVDGVYKEVLLLYYFEQKSYQEVAEILDIKSAHVGTLLLRAKQKLKQVVAQDPLLSEALLFDL